MSSSGIGSAEIVVAPLVLSTYALMATALAGRATVDLSIGPLIGFINVTLIQLGAAGVISSPIAVFAYALAAGVAYQIVFGLIVIWVRVQPIIVSLSGFLALSGINLVILPRPGGTAPEWMSNWGAGTSIFAPALFMVAAATVGWLIFSTTAFYGHLRLMGSDERAAYTSGVRIGVVRIGAHVVAGLFAGLAALAYHRADQFGRSDAGHHLHADLRHRAGAGRHQPRGRAGDGDRLAARRAQSVPDRLRARDLRFRPRAGLRHRSLLRRHSRAVVAADRGAALSAALAALCFAAAGVRRARPCVHRRRAARDLRLFTRRSRAASRIGASSRGSDRSRRSVRAACWSRSEQGPSFVRSPFATRVAQLGVLLLAVVAMLRILVWQAGKRGDDPAALCRACGCGCVVGAWLLIDTAAFVSRPGN